MSVRAPAKLTWSLRVVGVRDDGYHLIDAEMVTLDLADALIVAPSPATTLTVSGPFAGGVPLDASNLVLRALAVLERTAAVHLDKQIPNGGGLGGGSADAAAILRWAGVGRSCDGGDVGCRCPVLPRRRAGDGSPASVTSSNRCLPSSGSSPSSFPRCT